jgi:hypothetical protein
VLCVKLPQRLLAGLVRGGSLAIIAVITFADGLLAPRNKGGQ